MTAGTWSRRPGGSGEAPGAEYVKEVYGKNLPEKERKALLRAIEEVEE